MDDRETAWMEQIADLQASVRKICEERDLYKAALMEAAKRWCWCKQEDTLPGECAKCITERALHRTNEQKKSE